MTEDRPMPRSPNTTRRARELRNAPTPAEVLLWHRLRRCAVGGHRFRRQQPIGPYYADFCCLALRIVVELDGDTHEGLEERDARKDAYLAKSAFRVLRFWNDDVYRDVDAVVRAIAEACGVK